MAYKTKMGLLENVPGFNRVKDEFQKLLNEKLPELLGSNFQPTMPRNCLTPSIFCGAQGTNRLSWSWS